MLGWYSLQESGMETVFWRGQQNIKPSWHLFLSRPKNVSGYKITNFGHLNFFRATFQIGVSQQRSVISFVLFLLFLVVVVVVLYVSLFGVFLFCLLFCFCFYSFVLFCFVLLFQKKKEKNFGLLVIRSTRTKLLTLSFI